MNSIANFFKSNLRLGWWTLKDFHYNRCFSRASALTYTSLLAMVPLMVLMLSILSVSPSFDKMADHIQTFLFQNFIPSTGEVVKHYLQTFEKQARQLPTFAFIFLFVTAIMMMFTLENTLNDIWKIRYNRQLKSSILLYWSMLTLGPILIGTGLFVSSYFGSVQWFQGVSFSGVKRFYLVFLPFFFSTLAFMFLYMAVPHCKVKVKHALTGALVAAFLFEIAKRIFAFYVLHFPTYQLLYGALATIPLFLIWVYVSWVIFLFGATIVNGLRYNQAQRDSHKINAFYLTYRVLGHFWAAQKKKQSLSMSKLLKLEPHCSVNMLKSSLDRLANCGLIKEGKGEQLLLVGNLHDMTLWSFCHEVALYVPLKVKIEGKQDAWSVALNNALAIHNDYVTNVEQSSLSQLYAVKCTSSDLI